MTIWLDHVFILTDPDAHSAEYLSGLGLIEGPSNTHPGQGTSNRRFFLNGFTIELLFIIDRDEAVNGAGSVLGLVNRMEDATASPFGIVVRAASHESVPVFPHWLYQPDYFEAPLSFLVGDNSGVIEEPLCICMPPVLPESKPVPAEYANPQWKLTGLEINLPAQSPSDTLQRFAAIEDVSFVFGKPHKMLMSFNHGAGGRLEDLSPEIPLLVRW